MPTYYPPLSAAEMDTLRKMVHSALRSLAAHNKTRESMGKPPEYESRIEYYSQLAQKLQTK